ncbi:hypothetical protein ACA910_007980 [Epithemia clementina (nom. ined.)]
MFTILRRYSQGVLKETYSKYEVLLAGEAIKMVFSAFMIRNWMNESSNSELPDSSNSDEVMSHYYSGNDLQNRLWYLVMKSHKMMVLALIYGAMNILSFISLRNIGAGMFTVFAQCKILTTATFSTLLLQRHYSATKWRALIGLMFGVLLFSEPIWSPANPLYTKESPADANQMLGTAAVLAEVTLSGFASIYFEKVIKLDQLKLTIWERNFQLALTSFPVYLAFIFFDGGGPSGHFGGGWSLLTLTVAAFGAAGGLLVALSIKYGDAILKTLATTGAIVLSSVLDHLFLGGPLTPTMAIAGVQVILSIFNYTFDMTPANNTDAPKQAVKHSSARTQESGKSSSDKNGVGNHNGDEEMALLKPSADKS